MRIILASALSLVAWSAVYASEPATIVAVEGTVTIHSHRNDERRQAARGGRLDSASIISVPAGATARLRFGDLRGTEYSLPAGTYTLARARRLAQGARQSTFDRVKSFLHVTMGDQISPLDLAAYMPAFTRTDQAQVNIIWPEEWFGSAKPRLRYRAAGTNVERQADVTSNVGAVPTLPGLTMWVMEANGSRPAMARGFIHRDLQKPAELQVSGSGISTGQRIIAAYEAGYYRDAIRLLRDERKQEKSPDFLFEATLSPRLPPALIANFAGQISKLATGTRPCQLVPNLLVIHDDYVGVLGAEDKNIAANLPRDAAVYALSAKASGMSPWSGARSIAGGLTFEPEGAASAVLAGLWLNVDGTEKPRLERLNARIERLASTECLGSSQQ